MDASAIVALFLFSANYIKPFKQGSMNKNKGVLK